MVKKERKSREKIKISNWFLDFPWPLKYTQVALRNNNLDDQYDSLIEDLGHSYNYLTDPCKRVPYDFVME